MRAMLFRAAVVCTVGLLISAASCLAGETRPIELGTKLLPKAKAVVKMGEQTIDLATIPVPWVVQNVNGDFLLVGDRQKGWVLRSHVVTFDEGAEYFTEVIESAGDKHELIRAYELRALCWRQRGDHEREIADYTERLRLEDDGPTHNRRGIAWTTKKDYDKAIADFGQVLLHDPGNARAYDNRGIAWSAKKDYERALHDFGQAMSLNPSLPSAYNNAAWLMATCPQPNFRDGKRAVELATKACDLTVWVNASHVGTLAAAYAETGDFASAIRFQMKAIELNASQSDFVEAANARLALYKTNRPYREL